ncbi:type 1 fimbrial protein [Photobacterium angustum]|uniref:fimbrial protein n=1 Tax=Photobacterium angustum TaxID=661 RepID=UPI0005E12A6B|nr:fimbrial protein [Photobacterium angustum]KJG00454.1 hypothetical protein UB35_18210 [Photobacterium angustum]KJG15679.1 hypothetical protein UA33_18460 [Photobacterium angustum]KJG28032.1 hypothetical protein UA36_18830 [Photobacterium angustum]PSV66133.1 type 1 fimbrial protein [Photobacterium angustum]PSW97925.1 type 1 fimbrial protein [Photobacterium angustum]
MKMDKKTTLATTILLSTAFFSVSALANQGDVIFQGEVTKATCNFVIQDHDGTTNASNVVNLKSATVDEVKAGKAEEVVFDIVSAKTDDDKECFTAAHDVTVLWVPVNGFDADNNLVNLAPDATKAQKVAVRLMKGDTQITSTDSRVHFEKIAPGTDGTHTPTRYQFKAQMVKSSDDASTAKEVTAGNVKSQAKFVVGYR